EPHQTVELMAAEYVREIRTVQSHGPYFIGGSCVGGLVALETARQLRAQGEPLGLLVLVDSIYPSWARMLRTQLRNRWRNQVLPFLRRARTGPREFGMALLEAIQIRFAPTPDQRIGWRQQRIGRKYLRHLLRYKPRPYSGPLTLLVCEEHNGDPAHGW